MQLRGFAIVYFFMKLRWPLVCLCFVASTAVAQIQIELRFPRLQYIAYEPVVADLVITNLAGRDVYLRDADGQSWFGFEVSENEGRSIAPTSNAGTEPLNLAAGKRVTRKINLGPLFVVHDFGTYRVRAHIYFADLNKFFYSQTKVFEVTDARPIWQKTVGVPERESTSGHVRTYSLMTNRFPDHTSLYVRVEDKDSGVVYATYSLGQSSQSLSPRSSLIARTSFTFFIAPHRECGLTPGSVSMASSFPGRALPKTKLDRVLS